MYMLYDVCQSEFTILLFNLEWLQFGGLKALLTYHFSLLTKILIHLTCILQLIFTLFLQETFAGSIIQIKNQMQAEYLRRN